ncbi:hypothetical protein NSQ36_11930 [Bacillus sp. FSL W8-1143]|uniref:hypothetical protein n=1 Tax=Bacillus sp. FSL W8-1143 TaxID=2954647 RepID=UPI0030D03EF1
MTKESIADIEKDTTNKLIKISLGGLEEVYLKNIQLMSDDDHGNLASQSLCVTEMFLWELGKRIQTKDCEAIVLICGSFKDYKLMSTSKEEPNMLFFKKYL